MSQEHLNTPPEQHPEAGVSSSLPTIDAALFRELATVPEDVYIIVDKQGREYEASFVRAEDAVEISAIVQQNFDEAPSYANLTPEARAKYKAANTPEGIIETSQDQTNVASLVVRNQEGHVVGYRVVRQGKLRDEWKGRPVGTPVAEGKRMHIARGYDGRGLGTALLRLSEQIAREKGYQVMVVNASGDSYHFFMHAGYEVIAHEENPVLAAQGVRANRTYLGRELTTRLAE